MPNSTWIFDGTSVDYVADIGGPNDPDVVKGAERTWRLAFHSAAASGRHQAVLDYATTADTSIVDAGLTSAGEAWFFEDIPDSAPTETCLVKFEPTTIDIEGRWAVVTGGEDASNRSRSLRRVELNMVDLAPVGAYADATAVRDALQVGGSGATVGGGDSSVTGWTQVSVTGSYAAESGDSVWMDGSTQPITVQLPPIDNERNVRVVGVDDTNELTLTSNNNEAIEINAESQTSWTVEAGDEINVECNGTYWEAV
jgi:hypothetical protein